MLKGKRDTTVEALCWVGPHRLLSVGLHGQLTDWDLDALVPRVLSPSLSASEPLCVMLLQGFDFQTPHQPHSTWWMWGVAPCGAALWSPVGASWRWAVRTAWCGS